MLINLFECLSGFAKVKEAESFYPISSDSIEDPPAEDCAGGEENLRRYLTDSCSYLAVAGKGEFHEKNSDNGLLDVGNTFKISELYERSLPVLNSLSQYDVAAGYSHSVDNLTYPSNNFEVPNEANEYIQLHFDSTLMNDNSLSSSNDFGRGSDKNQSSLSDSQIPCNTLNSSLSSYSPNDALSNYIDYLAQSTFYCPSSLPNDHHLTLETPSGNGSTFANGSQQWNSFDTRKDFKPTLTLDCGVDTVDPSTFHSLDESPFFPNPVDFESAIETEKIMENQIFSEFTLLEPANDHQTEAGEGPSKVCYHCKVTKSPLFRLCKTTGKYLCNRCSMAKSRKGKLPCLDAPSAPFKKRRSTPHFRERKKLIENNHLICLNCKKVVMKIGEARTPPASFTRTEGLKAEIVWCSACVNYWNSSKCLRQI